MAPRIIGPQERRVYHLIAQRGGVARGQQRLAAELGISDVTLRLAYRRLESWDAIRHEHRPLPQGGRHPSYTRLTQHRPPTERPRTFGSAFGSDDLSKVRPSDVTSAGGAMTQPTRRPARGAAEVLDAWVTVYREVHGRPPLWPSLQARLDELPHCKRLLRLVPDPDERAAFLRVYARVEEGHVVAEGHPLRLALLGFRFPRLLRVAREEAAAVVRERLEAEEQARIAAETAARWAAMTPEEQRAYLKGGRRVSARR